jgi:dTDP-4-amino-4,6-dideoxygalactose transaminase
MVTLVRESQLAVAGGTPVRDTTVRPWPEWPVGTHEDVAAVAEVILSGRWTRWTGDRVEALEQALRAYTGARRAVAVANGTAALEIALKAVGVRPGDEVIVPAYSFVASATAVLQVGAVPVFADVQLETHNLDADSAESLVTERTRAILPVHMAGLPCDMDRIMDIARRHHLRVVEDAAQAIGGRWKDRRVGTIGDAGCYSFQASKNVSCGEGGAVVTNDDVVADKAFSRMHIGRKPGGEFYTHYVLGWNYRLTELQAALLLSQLERYPGLQARRRANAALLRAELGKIPGVVPVREDPFVTEHGLHGYSARFLSEQFAPGAGLTRAAFIRALGAEGIPCGAGYDHPLYRNPLFREAHQAMRDDCPFACAHPAALAADYSKVFLPNVERLCTEEALRFPQPLLLGTPEDMQDVVTAVAKVQANAGQLGQVH